MENLHQSSTHEITLFSDEDPANVVLNQIDIEIVQSSKMRGIYRKITVFDGTYCQQSIKIKHQKKLNFRVDLAFLYPLPVRVHHIAWKWAYCASGLTVLFAAMYWIGWLSGWFAPSIYYLTATIAVVSVGAISLLLLAHNSYDKVVFRSQHGGVNLVELLYKYPDKKSFKKFIGQFILKIKSAKKNKNLSPSKFLSGELKELRRLKDESVISAAVYEAAKVEIFHNESYQITDPRNLR